MTGSKEARKNIEIKSHKYDIPFAIRCDARQQFGWQGVWYNLFWVLVNSDSLWNYPSAATPWVTAITSALLEAAAHLCLVCISFETIHSIDLSRGNNRDNEIPEI